MLRHGWTLEMLALSEMSQTQPDRYWKRTHVQYQHRESSHPQMRISEGSPGAGFGWNWELLLNGYRVSIYSNENSILEIMCAGYTTWSVYLMLLNCTLKNGYKVANSVLQNLPPQKISPKQKNKTKILEEASGPQFTSSIRCHPMDPQAKPLPPPLCTWGPGKPATHTEPTSGHRWVTSTNPPNPSRRPQPAHRLPATLLTREARPWALGRRQRGCVSLKMPLRLLSKWCHVSKIGFIRCRQYPSQQIGVEEKKTNRTGSLTPGFLTL